MIVGKKVKIAYFCSQCGAEHSKWQGQCRECAAWNSLIEERVPVKRKAGAVVARETQLLSEISFDPQSGYLSGIAEFDRVLGGQLLPGMTILLGGDPGIGKSTLLLQSADGYARAGISVLYVTGEESLPQIRLRANRLNISGTDITVLNATSLEEITGVLSEKSFGVVLIDSIQTISSGQFDSPPGTVAQVREAANQLIMLAKSTGFSLFLVGHVTKEGLVAGPKVLEHMVDTVIYFEGDQTHLYRILRATKNRFGSVSEIGLFQMQGGGLVEVSNPSSFFLSGDMSRPRTGAVVTGICEGNRPLMVEVQALVTPANYGNPQRVAGGIDNKKLALLLAILDKRCGYPMATNDVFVSVAGGLRISEPSLDLAVMTSIASSLTNKTIDPKMLVVGEVGLSGEVRAVTLIEKRVAEAAKLGFTSVVLPQSNVEQITETSIELIGVRGVKSALDRILT
ncbi:MAG: DNA repair protein RadA [candidate division Zixibacteria bacterium]|nr:DNA repair protein RadA [candidate division Zixibacteria bacterium]